MTASVVIVSKNRRDELRAALRSAFAQSVPVEVVFVDDGSTDGTTDMVRREYPSATVIRHEQSRGYIAGRNEGARIAAGDIVFSIDDDAEFVSRHTVEQTLLAFDDVRIGAVAVPCREPHKGNAVFQRAPDTDVAWVTDCYIGTSHAVRRDLFLRLGGYRERLVHQGEERDYCIRMLAAGHVVRLGHADPIHHYESPKRDMRRMDYFGRRNDVLFAWHYVPMPWFPIHVTGTTINGLLSAWRARRAFHMVRGLLAGFADCATHIGERAPVTREVYRLHRDLRRLSPQRLDQILGRLPQISRRLAAD